MLPTIEKECSEFINNSNNYNLIKSFPKEYEGFRKVKVRKRNVNEIISAIFDKGLYNNKNITARSIFVTGESGYQYPPPNSNLEPFYIFPINGFKFKYNPIVSNINQQYNFILEKTLKIISPDVAIDMFSESLHDSYYSDNLEQAIKSGAELMIYNIPYFYAIKKSVVDTIKLQY